jgi:hypothetical protein
LEPGKPPKADKVAILSDATRLLSQLRAEAQKLQKSNESLQDSIKSLKVNIMYPADSPCRRLSGEKNAKMKWAFNMTAGRQVRAARREDEAEGRAGEAGADAQGRQRSSCPSTVPSAPCCRRCPAAVPPGGGVCSRWQVRPIRQLPAAGRVLAVDTADVP